MNPILVQLCETLPALRQRPVVDTFRQCLLEQGWPEETLAAWERLPVEEVAAEGVHAVTYRVGRDLARQVEADVHLAYHNRTHAAEAVTAASLLVGQEMASHPCRKEAALVLLTAMVAHDLGHQGWVKDLPLGAMELASANASLNAWEPYGYPRAWQVAADRVHSLILGTEFVKAPLQNALRLAAEPENWLARLAVLANDADILVSVLPGVGVERGHQLVEELTQSGHPHPEAIGSPAGRLGFLKMVQLRSRAAQGLGIERLREDQIQALEAMLADPAPAARAPGLK
jgi:hypothetical protein